MVGDSGYGYNITKQSDNYLEVSIPCDIKIFANSEKKVMCIMLITYLKVM
ncbi:MAG: hypothetical protein LBB45_00085 [Methanobrevibacter sp.]|nr:hypothetical protein [Candidatus Methanovirga basalitermitum]